MVQKTGKKKPYDKIALVLQGGGALGSYQVGVYNALCAAGYTPDWISGTSIGAINGAIIASNTQRDSHKKLDYFWQTISQQDIFKHIFSKPEARRWYNYVSGVNTALFGNPNMFLPSFANAFQSDPEKIGYYDPQPLRNLLKEVIDFDYLNSGEHMRLTIDAANVRTGKATYFDNTEIPILLEHIMASAALPPALPAVRIGNDLYWDAGILSNTPLGAIYENTPRDNILCFMIDLFNPRGSEPDSMSKVQMRSKEISYSSASDMHIAYAREAHNLRLALHRVMSMLPEEERNNLTTEKFKNLSYNTTIHIVHLIYHPKAYEWDTKDYNFSSMAISEHLNEGYLDARWALENSSWLEGVPPEAGVIVHEIKRGKKPVAIF